MSGTSRSNGSGINSSMIVEISEVNKSRACSELFGTLPKKQGGTVRRTFLYKGRRFLVTLKDITDGK